MHWVVVVVVGDVSEWSGVEWLLMGKFKIWNASGPLREKPKKCWCGVQGVISARKDGGGAEPIVLQSKTVHQGAELVRGSAGKFAWIVNKVNRIGY